MHEKVCLFFRQVLEIAGRAKRALPLDRLPTTVRVQLPKKEWLSSFVHCVLERISVGEGSMSHGNMRVVFLSGVFKSKTIHASVNDYDGTMDVHSVQETG